MHLFHFPQTESSHFFLYLLAGLICCTSGCSCCCPLDFLCSTARSQGPGAKQCSAATMSTEQVMCRCSVQRVCWEANKCLFSRDLPTSKSSSIFKYYQKGQCAYNAWYRCDHMRLTAPGEPQPLCCPWQCPAAPECGPTTTQSKQRKRTLRDRNLWGLSEEQQKPSAFRVVLSCSNQNNSLEVKPHYYLEAICSGLVDLVAGSSCAPSWEFLGAAVSIHGGGNVALGRVLPAGAASASPF